MKRADVPTTSEVAELVATIIQVVKEAKEFLEKQAVENKQELNHFVNRAVNDAIEKLNENLSFIEEKANEVIKTVKSDTKQDIDVLSKGIYLELKKLRDSIPSPTDISGVLKRLKEIEGKKITPEEARDGLETLQGEERLIDRAVQNVPRMTVSSTAPLNPEIGDLWGIPDQ